MQEEGKNLNLQPMLIEIKSKKTGISLLEVIITLGIMGILLSSIAVLLQRSMRISVIGKTRGGLQGEAISALGLMSRELMETDIRSVGINKINPDYPSVINFLSAIEVNGTSMEYSEDTGRMIWQKYIIYYIAQKSGISDYVLIRKEYDPSDPNAPLTMTTGDDYNDYAETIPLFYFDLKTICDAPQNIVGSYRLMARYIYDFQADSNILDSERFVSLKIVVRKTSLDNENPEYMEYKTKVLCRNKM